MKYYKLINASEYGPEYKQGIIYPETTCLTMYTVNEYIDTWPKDWQEVPEIEYLLQEGKFPKDYTVKCEKGNMDQWSIVFKFFYNYIPNVSYNLSENNYITIDENLIARPVGSKSEAFNSDNIYSYPVITFEQFEKYILKQKDMKKQDFTIEGTVALKKAFLEESGLKNSEIEWNFYLTSSGSYKKALTSQEPKENKHFILPKDWDDTLEYVKNYWEDEFKVGEYYTYDSDDYIGSTDKLIGFHNDGKLRFEGREKEECDPKNYRKATPEEIKKIKIPKIRINGYDGEFLPEIIRFDYAEIDPRIFQDIVQVQYKGNRQIESITIGKGTFSKADISQIAEYYNNLKK